MADMEQMIRRNLIRGAAQEGEMRANVGDPTKMLQLRRDTDGVLKWENAGDSPSPYTPVTGAGAMSAPKVTYSNASAPAPAPSPAPQQAPAAGAMSAPAGGKVDSTYRTPLQSRLEGLANPFGENYQQRLAGQGISNAEQQYRQAADRTRSMLASRGLMSGGGTGLQASLMNQAAMDAAGARERALTGAATDTATRAADFEFKRAGAIDAYNRGLMSDAQVLSLLPSQVSIAQSQARGAKIDADVAERTVGARERMVGSQADMAQSQADIAKVDAQIKAMAPDQQKAIRDAMIKKAVNEGIISDKEVAAADQLLQRNANDWPEWGKNFLRGGLVLGGAALGGIGGFFAGGVGAVPGALAGAAAGTAAAGTIR